jgi:GTPase SAR1 family protein
MAESPQAEPRGLHLVLFGMAASGKSSLLGALVQAAQGQQQVLGGKLNDVPDSMEELRKRLYENKLPETRDEIVLYPLTYDGPAGATPLTLVDCDGRVAQQYIVGKSDLADASSGPPLSEAIAEADTLILPVDASAPPAQLDRDFAQFGAFLRLLEEHRSHENEASGLPVYLVLTKCDLLARPDDSASKWLQRIEEGKRKIDLKFREFLARQDQEMGGLFGAIDLHLWATAIKRPALSDRPARPAEPFGVAELFRQAVASGSMYRRHRARTGRKLAAAALGVAILIGFMSLLAVVVYWNRPSADVVALETQIRQALPVDHSDRLREPVEDRLQQLRSAQSAAAFPRLPSPMRQDVSQAIDELDAFQKWSKEFKSKVQDPRHISREEELARNEKLLDNLTPPSAYEQDWSETKLEQRRLQWQGELKRFRAAIDDEIAWMHAQTKQAEQLRKKGGLVIAQAVTPAEREEWLTQVRKNLDGEMRHQRTERIAGAKLTYENVYRFDRVEQARRDWDKSKRALEKVREQAQ